MFLRNCYHIILSLLTFFNYGEGARILGAVFTPSYSHQITFWPIWKELALRGHELVILTTDPMNNSSLTNIREIDLSFSHKLMKSEGLGIISDQNKGNIIKRFQMYLELLSKIADQQLNHPEVQQLIHNETEYFDLLMVEITFPTQMAFSVKFDVPFIGLISYEPPDRIHSIVGNYFHPYIYPNINLPFVKNLNFLQRLISFFTTCYLSWYSIANMYLAEDKTVKKHFGNNMPLLSDIEKNMSLMFVNTNPVLQIPRPITPATIQIGGGLHLHGRSKQYLPKDIQQYLDNAKEGFIYMSLGTNFESSSLSTKTRNTIVETFNELPYKVLWKFENQNILNDTKNIKLSKWLPQVEVLEHPNIKLFITQGGIQSIEEAILNDVPMIALPCYGDQFHNSENLVLKGIGLKFGIYSLEKIEFKNAIEGIIHSPKYKRNIKVLSNLLKDVEASGLDKAIWWTEYVLRHKGALHLKSPEVHLPYYKYYLIDVIFFILLITFIPVVILYQLFKLFIKSLCNKLKNKKKKE